LFCGALAGSLAPFSRNPMVKNSALPGGQYCVQYATVGFRRLGAATPTGKDTLLDEHRAWLEEAAKAIPANRDFTIYLFGYASKLGFHGLDQKLSDAENVDLFRIK
jgi:hypothetical protein